MYSSGFLFDGGIDFAKDSPTLTKCNKFDVFHDRMIALTFGGIYSILTFVDYTFDDLLGFFTFVSCSINRFWYHSRSAERKILFNVFLYIRYLSLLSSGASALLRMIYNLFSILMDSFMVFVSQGLLL